MATGRIKATLFNRLPVHKIVLDCETPQANRISASAEIQLGMLPAKKRPFKGIS
jgi:hypothetical protein